MDIRELLKSIPGYKDKGNPVKYLLCMIESLFGAQKYITIYNLWFRQEDILNILNFLLNANYLPPEKIQLLSHRFLAGFMIFVYAGMGAFNLIFISRSFTLLNDKANITKWSSTEWWNGMIGYGRQMFFQKGGRNNGTNGSFGSYADSDYLFGFLGIFGNWQR